MKKSKMILLGVLTVLFYDAVYYLNILIDNKFAAIADVNMFKIVVVITWFVLPALPGVALAFFLVQKSMRAYFIGLGICVLSSLCTFLILAASGAHLMTYRLITGFEEPSNGADLLMGIMIVIYAHACIIGSFAAGIRTAYLQWRAERK